MELGQWLNSLAWLDHVVILLFFVVASYLAQLSIAGFKHIIQLAQKRIHTQVKYNLHHFCFLGLQFHIQ